MERKIQYWLYSLAFIDLFGASCIVTLLGVHLRGLGFSHSSIGIMSFVYAAVQLFSGPIIGGCSDKFGRKTVLCITLFVCSFAYLIYSVASSFGVLLFLRVVLGSAKHTQTICKAMVADLIPVNKQSDCLGKLSAVAVMGFIFGPVIGGHMLSGMVDGFIYVCYITFLLFFINGFIVYFLFPDVKCLNDNEKLNKSSLKDNIYQTFLDLYNVDWKSYWDVFLLKLILSIAVSVFFSNYYLYIEENYKISHKYIGYTISFQGLISALSGLASDSFNKIITNDPSNSIKIFRWFILLAISFLFIYFSPNVYVFVLCLLPLSCGSTMLRNMTADLIFVRSGSDHVGSLMGASNSVASLGRMIAPLLTGFLQDLFKFSGVSVLIAFLLSVFGALISRLICAKMEINKIKK